MTMVTSRLGLTSRLVLLQTVLSFVFLLGVALPFFGQVGFLVAAAGALLTAMVALVASRWLFAPIGDLAAATRQLASDSSFPLPKAPGELSSAVDLVIRRNNDRLATVERERGQLTAILDGMPVGVMLFGDSGEVLLSNPAAHRLLGTYRTGRSLVEAVRHHELVELVRKAIAGDAPAPRLTELVAPRRTVRAQARPLAGPGRGTLLLVQDVTEERRSETVRRDFVANVSHELRTPVASLKLLTESLLDGALDDPEAAPRFLDRIAVEIDRLSQMVQELFELSRIESGDLAIQPRPTEVAALLRSAADRLADQAQRAGLALETMAPATPPVLADPVRIEQVLVNLIHNAIKFTDPGGTVRIGVNADLLPSTATTPAQACLWVADTGVGIPAADLPRVFERFFKTDRSRTGAGTGLGLAIAKHTIQAHGGRIWATSTVGQGSTFCFTLPVVEAPVPAEAASR